MKRLSEQEHEGDVEVKEFLMAYIEMEKALRSLPIFNVQKGEKQPTVTEMLKELKYRQFIEAQTVDDMIALTRLRNLIIHGAEIHHVELLMYDKAKKYTNDLITLKDNL